MQRTNIAGRSIAVSSSVLFLVFASIGCGGSDDSSGGNGSAYGANKSVPPTKNCQDLCRRTSDCAVHLCAEDTGSTTYLELANGMTAQCVSNCQSTALAAIPDAKWACMFTASCRESFGNDSCELGGHYSCSSGSAMASFPPGTVVR